MMKSKYEMLIDGLKGIPIVGLVENWDFTIKEIAPYVFEAQGRGPHWQTTTGYGGTAENALNDCMKKANKIVLREKRRLALEHSLAKMKDKIEHIIGKK